MTTRDHPDVVALAQRLASAGWEVIAEIRSQAGVELWLHPAPHVWDFPRLGQRVAYGRDDQDAMRRVLRQLDGEQVAAVDGRHPAERGRNHAG